MIYVSLKKRFAVYLLIVAPFIFSFSSPNPVASQDDKLIVLLKTARKYLGTKYKSGGTNPKGFDCSGFVRYVYKKVQVPINGSSSAALYKKGSEIPRKQCKPGDLIFFSQSPSKNKVINHVGIIVHSDSLTTKFIHASTTKGVIISNLNSPYYKQRFAGVRRIPYFQESTR